MGNDENQIIVNYSDEAKNALHRLTYSEDLRMQRMLEDAWDAIDALCDANGLVKPAKPAAVEAEITARKADRAIVQDALRAAMSSSSSGV